MAVDETFLHNLYATVHTLPLLSVKIKCHYTIQHDSSRGNRWLATFAFL